MRSTGRERELLIASSLIIKLRLGFNLKLNKLHQTLSIKFALYIIHGEETIAWCWFN